MKEGNKIIVIALAVIVMALVVVCMYNVIEGGTSDAAPTPTEKVEEQLPSPTPTPTEVPTSKYPVRETASVIGTRLSERYKDNFYVGTCIKAEHLDNPELVALVLEQFNSITLENDMKPEALLYQMACIAENDVKVVFPQKTIRILDWARDNGFAVRGHVLVWYSQTPDWFFREGFKSDGAYVDRETMLARMESYIQQVITYCETNYPGLIYAWDVVNEAFEDNGGGMRDCPWYRIIGEDYIKQAFVCARKYAPEGVKLFYNDFNSYIPAKETNIYMMARSLKEEGVIDGIGMQSHLDVGYPTASQYLKTLEKFSNLGLEVQITELDITTDKSTDGFERQSQMYYDIFKGFVTKDLAGMVNVTSVTVWGVNDGRSWRASQYPLLFDDDLKPKAAYFSMLQQDN